MKKSSLILLAALLLQLPVALAQDKSNRPSPPAQVSASLDGLEVTIDYSRPSAKGRQIFGGLESYGKVWRTGANETTWIALSQDSKVNGQSLTKGKYGLFTIPGEEKWTIIFNKDWEGWGAFRYNQDNDVLRIEVDADNDAPMTEQFTIGISEQGEVSLAWDKTAVSFTLSK